MPTREEAMAAIGRAMALAQRWLDRNPPDGWRLAAAIKLLESYRAQFAEHWPPSSREQSSGLGVLAVKHFDDDMYGDVVSALYDVDDLVRAAASRE